MTRSGPTGTVKFIREEIFSGNERILTVKRGHRRDPLNKENF
jgi:hypothetical protein